MQEPDFTTPKRESRWAAYTKVDKNKEQQAVEKMERKIAKERGRIREGERMVSSNDFVRVALQKEQLRIIDTMMMCSCGQFNES